VFSRTTALLIDYVQSKKLSKNSKKKIIKKTVNSRANKKQYSGQPLLTDLLNRSTLVY
jgi:hypothetical protein